MGVKPVWGHGYPWIPSFNFVDLLTNSVVVKQPFFGVLYFEKPPPIVFSSSNTSVILRDAFVRRNWNFHLKSALGSHETGEQLVKGIGIRLCSGMSLSQYM